eukprot:CAMPEP_0183301720 /NCGR_PEP_ID=MMETSP0160_2-20130417/7746_1 /TAXON_ID=2839 ORGANISM="Odontella Sinensis, Strain Grunow 1884" /NCGR_SAMPLE_ID=MMETSP0160_2 /ASSEMBLY_ACC=CAM_ASM_000250 /LENGTH=305 /DNA_ID=CAMNT_0025464391 /DNA_START=67 /DNA_END=984 /DNA_ORIENTATION=-
MSSNDWTGDGSEGELSVNESKIRFSSKTSGTPFNVRLAGGVSSSESLFFEVEILELSGFLAVGVVSEDGFLPGWKNKGMFYNGNLTNGSAGLLIDFGDRPSVGDKIGVFVERSTDGVKVIFYLGKRCLGAGFHLDGENDVFFPCLSVTGLAVVKYGAPKIFPCETNRQAAKFSDSYCGDWTLKKAFEGPELVEKPIPEDANIILRLSLEDGDRYALSLKVGNKMHTTLKLSGKLDAFDTIEVGMLSSTRMLPPPELFDMESFLSTNLPNLHKMIVGEDGILIMTGEAQELHWGRHQEEFQPLREY